MQNIKIFDTTLRDGEQSPGASLNRSEKLIIAKQLERLGVDIIEAGFPIASEDDFQAVKEIAKEVKRPIICALARSLEKDIDRAWEALKYSKKPRIHTFIATSSIHLKSKLKMSKEEVLKVAENAVRYAKSKCKDIEFSPEDAARTDINYMCDVIRAAITAGATTINIPDTVGYSEPEEFGERVRYVFQTLGDLITKNNVTISVHCHNDLGLAVANSLAGVKNGATQVECTINGIGERAGNCSLEEVVMNLHVRSDYFKNLKTNIDTKELFRTSKLVSSLTGLPVQRNKAIVGKNAFAHEAGIHQQGVLADRSTYEIMKPEDVGWEGESFVIGKHSGTSAIKSVLKNLNYNILSEQQIVQITQKVKDLADKKKFISDEDIVAIADDVAGSLSEEEQAVKIDEIIVLTGNKITPTATVKLFVDGKERLGSASGVGPVDALSKVIREIVDPTLTLAEYSLKAITGGTDALADVTAVICNKKGEKFKARAVNEDIVMASALAIVHGVNKALKNKV